MPKSTANCKILLEQSETFVTCFVFPWPTSFTVIGSKRHLFVHIDKSILFQVATANEWKKVAMHQCNGWQGSRLNGWRIASSSMGNISPLHPWMLFVALLLTTTAWKFCKRHDDDTTGVCQFNCYIAISDYYLSLEQPQLRISSLNLWTANASLALLAFSLLIILCCCRSNKQHVCRHMYTLHHRPPFIYQ